LLISRFPVNTSEATLDDPKTGIKSRGEGRDSPEDTQSFQGPRMAERVFGLFKLPYQEGHEFGQLFFFGRKRAASSIELFEFRNHALVLFLGRDHPRQRLREQLAVCAFVDGRGYSHFFHAPLSYSAWVKSL
jgi:hypothetical protein